MELPKRPHGDEFTRPGAYRELSQRLADNPKMRDLTALIMYAFDARTRLLPFLFADWQIIPAGVRAVADSLDHAGLTKSRVVFQLWSPNVRPSRSLIDGEVPDLLLISSMQIHAARAYEWLADAHQIPESRRPLILCGGPKSIYEPWDYFARGEHGEINADVAVTGEAYVMLSLIERLLEYKGSGDTMRQAFIRARCAKALEDIPGLVYRQDPADGSEAHLADTGVQRLVQYLDEMPMPLKAYSKLEPPHKGEALSAHPVAPQHVHKMSRVSSLVMTQGCKFRCNFCPIPAYNQNSFRFKSPERLGEEMTLLNQELGLRTFFGTDDNFLNHKETAAATFEHLASLRIRGRRFNWSVRWATEATIHDAHGCIEMFETARQAGLRALWFGIEDLTATMVKKGQAVSKTEEVFREMVDRGLCPMPMMMHHDGQPLSTPGKLYGLKNQVRLLRKAGAISIQITALTPAVGTNFFEKEYEEGRVFESVAGRRVEEAMFDGNHIVASGVEHPWRMQMNVVKGYAAFYNPWNLIMSMVRPKRRLAGADIGMQLIGITALAKTAVDSFRWSRKLKRGPIVRSTQAPGTPLPLVKVRPEEIETTRRTAIPPDSAEVYGITLPGGFEAPEPSPAKLPAAS